MDKETEHLHEKLTGKELAEYKRMSGRNEEQFKVEIKQAHLDEHEIIHRYASYRMHTTGEKVEIIDNGIDMSGEFLEVSQVKNDADYIVNGKKMEVKTVKKDLFQFRLKLNLIKSYIEQNASMLLVLGWETDSPVFTVLEVDDLKHMAKFGKKTVSNDWEGKPSVNVYKNSYEWNPLPILN